jgi:putative membrane protein
MLKHYLVIALLAISGAAFAKTTIGPDLSVKDRQFIEKVASGNMAEIKLARLALDKSQSPTVRQYAQMIIDDHEKAAKELKTIAREEKFPEPTTMDTEHQKLYDKLATESGKDFDKDYMKLMVKEHDKTIDDFQKASNELTNPELKSFVTKTLPTLKEHKEHAKSDVDTVKKEKE